MNFRMRLLGQNENPGFLLLAIPGGVTATKSLFISGEKNPVRATFTGLSADLR
jgi:hypothetical protein